MHAKASALPTEFIPSPRVQFSSSHLKGQNQEFMFRTGTNRGPSPRWMLLPKQRNRQSPSLDDTDRSRDTGAGRKSLASERAQWGSGYHTPGSTAGDSRSAGRVGLPGGQGLDRFPLLIAVMASQVHCTHVSEFSKPQTLDVQPLPGQLHLRRPVQQTGGAACGGMCETRTTTSSANPHPDKDGQTSSRQPWSWSFSGCKANTPGRAFVVS